MTQNDTNLPENIPLVKPLDVNTATGGDRVDQYVNLCFREDSRKETQATSLPADKLSKSNDCQTISLPADKSSRSQASPVPVVTSSLNEGRKKRSGESSGRMFQAGGRDRNIKRKCLLKENARKLLVHHSPSSQPHQLTPLPPLPPHLHVPPSTITSMVVASPVKWSITNSDLKFAEVEVVKENINSQPQTPQDQEVLKCQDHMKKTNVALLEKNPDSHKNVLKVGTISARSAIHGSSNCSAEVESVVGRERPRPSLDRLGSELKFDHNGVKRAPFYVGEKVSVSELYAHQMKIVLVEHDKTPPEVSSMTEKQPSAKISPSQLRSEKRNSVMLKSAECPSIPLSPSHQPPKAELCTDADGNHFLKNHSIPFIPNPFTQPCATLSPQPGSNLVPSGNPDSNVIVEVRDTSFHEEDENPIPCGYTSDSGLSLSRTKSTTNDSSGKNSPQELTSPSCSSIATSPNRTDTGKGEQANPPSGSPYASTEQFTTTIEEPMSASNLNFSHPSAPPTEGVGSPPDGSTQERLLEPIPEPFPSLGSDAEYMLRNPDLCPPKPPENPKNDLELLPKVEIYHVSQL